MNTLKCFRIWIEHTPVSSMYDRDSETGHYRTRIGTLWNIEFWLYKFSVRLEFVWWRYIE